MKDILNKATSSTTYTKKVSRSWSDCDPDEIDCTLTYIDIDKMNKIINKMKKCEKCYCIKYDHIISLECYLECESCGRICKTSRIVGDVWMDNFNQNMNTLIRECKLKRILKDGKVQ